MLPLFEFRNKRTKIHKECYIQVDQTSNTGRPIGTIEKLVLAAFSIYP